jgi:hypothetical protein
MGAFRVSQRQDAVDARSQDSLVHELRELGKPSTLGSLSHSIELRRVHPGIRPA